MILSSRLTLRARAVVSAALQLRKSASQQRVSPSGGILTLYMFERDEDPAINAATSLVSRAPLIRLHSCQARMEGGLRLLSDNPRKSSADILDLDYGSPAQQLIVKRGDQGADHPIRPLVPSPHGVLPASEAGETVKAGVLPAWPVLGPCLSPTALQRVFEGHELHVARSDNRKARQSRREPMPKAMPRLTIRPPRTARVNIELSHLC